MNPEGKIQYKELFLLFANVITMNRMKLLLFLFLFGILLVLKISFMNQVRLQTNKIFSHIRTTLQNLRIIHLERSFL